MKKIILISCLLFPFVSRAGLNLDSLYAKWNDKTQTDSVRLMAMWYLCYDGFLYSNPDSSYALAQQMYDFAVKTHQLQFQGHALGTMGAASYYLGKHTRAIECHKRSLAISTKMGNKGSQAAAMNNIANIFRDQGKADDALDYFRRSLKIYRDMDNKQGISTVLANIGAVYSDQNDYENSMLWYKQAYRIKKEIDDPLGLSLILASIGNCYFDAGKYDSAMAYQQQSLSIRKKINNRDGMAYCFDSMAEIFQAQHQPDSAMRYYTRSLSIFDELRSNPGITDVSYALSVLYRQKKDFSNSIRFGERSLEVARESGLVEGIRNAARTLYESYKAVNRHRDALEMHELFMLMRDSTSRIANQQALIQQRFMHEYERKSIADSLNFLQKAKMKEFVYNARLEREQNQRYLLYGGIGVLLLLGVLIFRSYRLKKKDNLLIAQQKKEVELQKHLVEEKNHEILDSINYAKRLQDAILPADDFVRGFFPESFILYQPKDIVAGDFYWMAIAENKEERKKKNEGPEGQVSHFNSQILVAACDCTGHGVPGAMVSVVCHNALNRAVREFGLTDPGKILDKTRELVIEHFDKGDHEVKDGMDISLASLRFEICDWKFEMDNQEKSQTPCPKSQISNSKPACWTGRSQISLRWSGANNPLWYIKKGEFHEIKGDKQPIGYSDVQNPFTTHSVTLEAGDTFYLFTDGYQDQFGGPKGKKFKASNLGNLLLSIQEKDLEEQHNILEKTLHDWKDELEQVDDVCIIGIKVR